MPLLSRRNVEIPSNTPSAFHGTLGMPRTVQRILQAKALEMSRPDLFERLNIMIDSRHDAEDATDLCQSAVTSLHMGMGFAG